MGLLQSAYFASNRKTCPVRAQQPGPKPLNRPITAPTLARIRLGRYLQYCNFLQIKGFYCQPIAFGRI
jgi:hypothetical protein